MFSLMMHSRVVPVDCVASAAFGKLTELTIVPVSRKLMIWRAAISAQLSSASAVDAPRCGMHTNFGSSCGPHDGSGVSDVRARELRARIARRACRCSSGAQTYLPAWPLAQPLERGAVDDLGAREVEDVARRLHVRQHRLGDDVVRLP